MNTKTGQKNQLKNHLKLLKSQNPKPSWVLQKLWKYFEKAFEPQSEKIQSTFNETDCKQYFRKILSEKNRHKTFKPLSWMKKLDEPTINFHLETPSYAEITKIIVRMKSSASPYPYDAISIIAIKKCPILRSDVDSAVIAFNILER